MKSLSMMIIDHFDFYGLQANENQLKLWAEQLNGLDIAKLYAAMKKSWADGSNTRPVMPAKLIELTLGIIPPNEAWAKVEKLSNDESAAVVWTEEMRLAWGDAYNLASSDMVAARMTFLESYRNRISSLIAEKKYPKYVLTHGSRENNKAALLDAIATNKMSPDLALKYEPDLEIPKSLINSLQIEHRERLQLEHRIKEMEPDPNAQEKIKEMISQFFEQQDLRKKEAAEKREEERKREKARIIEIKNEQLKRLEQEK